MKVHARSGLAGALLGVAGVVLGTGSAWAVTAVAQADGPGSYQSWGPNRASSGGVGVAQGQGTFGERSDATAVGGTQSAYDMRPGGDGAYVQVVYYFYGPQFAGTGSQWYQQGSDQTPDWYSASWHGTYESAALVRSADRARAELHAGLDESLAPDPKSAVSILTTSY